MRTVSQPEIDQQIDEILDRLKVLGAIPIGKLTQAEWDEHKRATQEFIRLMRPLSRLP
jgi:hypothetical protein